MNLLPTRQLRHVPSYLYPIHPYTFSPSKYCIASPLKIGTKRFWKSTPSAGFRDSKVESAKSHARWGKRVTRNAVKPSKNVKSATLEKPSWKKHLHLNNLKHPTATHRVYWLRWTSKQSLWYILHILSPLELNTNDFQNVALSQPPNPWISKLAPPCKRARTTIEFPLKHAWCKGVQPSVSRTSGSAPLLNKSWAISVKSFRAAKCKGARP